MGFAWQHKASGFGNEMAIMYKCGGSPLFFIGVANVL